MASGVPGETSKRRSPLDAASQLGVALDALAAVATHLSVEAEGIDVDPSIRDLLTSVASEVLDHPWTADELCARLSDPGLDEVREVERQWPLPVRLYAATKPRPASSSVAQVRAAISMPQRFADGTFDPQSFRAFLGRAEALGFESAWTQEQVLGRFPQLGPTETMTFAAACTERIRLGCAVYVTPLHNPVHLAKSMSTLDQLSGGRLEVGVGSGGKRRAFAAFGVDSATYIARFTEGVELMKACWTEPTITFDGRFWQMHGAEMEPKPMQKPFPPVWFGGGHPNALRRAVRFGGGFFGAGSSTTAQFREQVRDLRTILAEEGRDVAGFPVAKRVYIHVDEDTERAARLVSQNLAQIYAHLAADFTGVAVYGSARTCIEGVREVMEAGAELVLFTPLHDEAVQMERLAAEVVSAF